jgi:hypothetical protein
VIRWHSSQRSAAARPVFASPGGTPVVVIGNSASRLLVDFTRACRPDADRCAAEESDRSHHERFTMETPAITPSRGHVRLG